MSSLTTGGAKRKAAPNPSAQTNDAAAVARALKNVTRIGATFATATTDKFVIPAIAFKARDDPEDEQEALSVPLRKIDAQKIKARGVATQHHNDKPVAWEVAGDVLESQNPKWQGYLDAFIASKRKRLAIASSATVEVKLNRLLLAEEGGRLLKRPRAEGRSAGAFGRLLVVLPGSFAGGDVLVNDFMPFHDDDELVRDKEWEEHEDSAECHAVIWRRDEQPGEAFDLMCAAFHDCCEIEPEPIESGAALCLVYDLVTTTAPTLIRFYAGPEAVQQSVNTALSEFFTVVPSNLTKRLKITPDVWRTIDDFIIDKQFAYLVDAEDVEDLDKNEVRIAQSLAAFCRQSGGKYVLYHSSVLCSRLAPVQGNSSGSTVNEDGFRNDSDATCNSPLAKTRVTLTAPWIKFDELQTELSCPPVFIHPRDVAPVGLAEQLQLYVPDPDNDDERNSILRKLYGGLTGVRVRATYALVVMPASVERRQIAKLPIQDALSRLYAMLSKSRDEALVYARRVVHYRPMWSISYDDPKLFNAFVMFAVKVNDRRLFKEMLLTVHLEITDEKRTLWKAIKHFGYDACIDTIVQRVRSTPTLGGRIHFVLAVIDSSLSSSRIEALLDVLLSLPPWTDVQFDATRRETMYRVSPSSKQLRKLLGYAYYVSPQKAIQLVSVIDPAVMVQLVLPALVPEYGVPYTVSRDLLVHAYEIFKPMKPEIRNELFAKIQLPTHCAKRGELQSFLLSHETETTIECADEEEVRHVRDVLRSRSGETAKLYATRAGELSLRIAKELHKSFTDRLYGSSTLYFEAQDVEQEVLNVLSPGTAIEEHDY